MMTKYFSRKNYNQLNDNVFTTRGFRGSSFSQMKRPIRLMWYSLCDNLYYVSSSVMQEPWTKF